MIDLSKFVTDLRSDFSRRTKSRSGSESFRADLDSSIISALIKTPTDIDIRATLQSMLDKMAKHQLKA